MDNSADGTTCTATSSAGNSTGQKFTRNSEQPKAPEKRNVLVVDDLYLNRIVLGKLLAGFGFVVTYSSDGQEAVETFQKRKESNEDFYAILMVRPPALHLKPVRAPWRSIDSKRLCFE